MFLSRLIRPIRALAAIHLLFLPATLAQRVASRSVAESQQHLLQLTVTDDMNTVVPLPVRDSIEELKGALEAETDAVVSRMPRDAAPGFVKERVLKAMPPPTVGKISDEQWRKLANSDANKPVGGLYGGELTISVKQPKPSLLLVQEAFNIACGQDNVLLVYSNTGGDWKRILTWQSKPYTSVGEAFGDTYETMLLRPQLHGHPLLLVVHGTPWCTSTVSGFSMDVLELGDAASSMPLWHGAHDYRLDVDPPLTVRATIDGFEVRTSVNAWGEGDRVSRRGVMRYAVAADGVHRVEPIAMNARDSVEEWLGMSLAEAHEFADETDGSLTWTLFDNFTYEGKPKDADVPLANVGAVHACKDDTGHFQVDVTSTLMAPGLPGGRPGPAYFVQVHQVPNGYRIHAVTRTKDRACTGPAL